MGAGHITDNDFDAHIASSDKPVLVDFWAEWCGPCRQVGPIVDQLADELGEKVNIVKMNIDENPNTPSKLGVRGIPTLMVFKNGELAGTKVGALPKPQLLEWLEGLAS